MIFYVAYIAVLIATGLPLWVGLVFIGLRTLIVRAEAHQRALARLC
jgi:hypothetical protein